MNPQQRIAGILKQRLVREQAIDWVDIDELAEELIHELGLPNP